MGDYLLKAEKLFGVIGHPIGHSMSPAIHNDQFQHQGLPYFYHAFDVDSLDLKHAIEGMKRLGVSGFNVTVPHKVEVMQYLDDIEDDAQTIGAVNTVVSQDGRLIGYNTDGKGYLTSLLQTVGEKLHDNRVLVIGAGGAARAVITALNNYGVKQLAVTNRTPSKAETIKDRVNPTMRIMEMNEAKDKLDQFDVIINTTSVGMPPQQDNVPLEVTALKDNALLSDLIYNPLETKWLQQGKSYGAQTLNGIGMFVGQGAVAFELWTGIWPDTERMTEVVLDQLRRK
ncbi:shikimate dehydrogenase [Alteribacillus persepolensis]|uniref:Shikimate dehydrogenase (NADP(+)) n=1 Tax=Alteribacillus persepolensis TaxID=568899 RepID=A0A1G8CMQ8_9BACI|nr:shikimate dehydrogenase [Alteribacillus persepolensis]SDH46696.1 shikimate dehydrogenase [Alteribacillus persepolensis]